MKKASDNREPFMFMVYCLWFLDREVVTDTNTVSAEERSIAQRTRWPGNTSRLKTRHKGHKELREFPVSFVPVFSNTMNYQTIVLSCVPEQDKLSSTVIKLSA
jgi:hypothetical protein